MDDLSLFEQLLEDAPEAFIIDTDAKAEWAARRVRDTEKEWERLDMAAREMIRYYEDRRLDMRLEYEAKTDHLSHQLESYFETVPRKATKTQETYALPGYKLKRKRQQPTFTRDNDKLLSWARDAIGSGILVRVKEEPAWDMIKASCIVEGEALVFEETGEIVPGVRVVERPPVFTIEDIGG